MRIEKSNSCIPDIWLKIHEEAKPNAGEDNYCFSFGGDAALLAAFDGCGGAGAQRYEGYGGRTEAYMASRFCAGAFYDSFLEMFPGKGTNREKLEAYLDRATERCSVTLSTFRPPQKTGGSVKGSMVRTLPSTAAIVLVQPNANGSYAVNAVWAGDSRCYLLTEEGLGQLTKDDTSVPDPMDNLYEDGVLKNIIHEGKKMVLHVGTFNVQKPYIVLTATDGCFGYFTTPMEFEGVILQSMLVAKNPEQWEDYMKRLMGKFAGDDYTMVLAGYGFRNFDDMKRHFFNRAKHLQEAYLDEIQKLPAAEREPRQQMWEKYKHEYMRYIEED